MNTYYVTNGKVWLTGFDYETGNTVVGERRQYKSLITAKIAALNAAVRSPTSDWHVVDSSNNRIDF